MHLHSRHHYHCYKNYQYHHNHHLALCFVFLVVLVLEQKKSLLGCKEQLPAPGNRSNERRDREKDLATTGEKKVGTGEKNGRRRKSRGREK
ncbi:hypothetical protein TNCV_4483221 [Trichonephila clavipes]|nr:hypothetical protein TNCV_4483221 [Trichonephila clavipes]